VVPKLRPQRCRFRPRRLFNPTQQCVPTAFSLPNVATTDTSPPTHPVCQVIQDGPNSNWKPPLLAPFPPSSLHRPLKPSLCLPRPPANPDGPTPYPPPPSWQHSRHASVFLLTVQRGGSGGILFDTAEYLVRTPEGTERPIPSPKSRGGCSRRPCRCRPCRCRPCPCGRERRPRAYRRRWRHWRRWWRGARGSRRWSGGRGSAGAGPELHSLRPNGVCIPAQDFQDNIDDFVAYNFVVQN